MRNLAGRDDSDIWAASELTAAGIDIEVAPKPYGEPQTRVKGRLGGVEFTRAWRYWVADGRVPLDIARCLYEHPVGRRDVRVRGYAGNAPPEGGLVDYYTADGKEVVIDADGSQEAEYDRLAKKGLLDRDDKPRFAKTADGLAGFVCKYHIDSAEGLRLFADALRGSET